MNKVFYISFFLIGSFCLSQDYTLYDAQAYALNHKEEIKKANLDLQIAEKKINETRAIGLPQINAEGNFNHFINLPVQVVDGAFIGQPGTLVSFRAGTDYAMNAGISVNQLVFDGSYIVGLQVSKYFKEFVESNIELTKESVIENVKRAYEMALVSKHNAQFLDSIVFTSESLLNEQLAYLELNLITQEEIDQSKYMLASAKTNQISAQNQFENALVMLKLSMGYPLSDTLNMLSSLEELIQMAKQLDFSENSISSNLQLEILEKRLNLSKYELKNARYASLPSIGAYFQHKYDAYRNEFNFFSEGEWYEQTFVGVRLNVPIFSSGRGSSRVKQAQFEIEKKEFELEEFNRLLEAQEIQSINNYNEALAKLQLQEENLMLAKKIYSNSLNKSKIGKESSLLVTQKHAQVIMAQAQYVAQMVNVFDSALKIEKLYNKLNTK